MCLVFYPLNINDSLRLHYDATYCYDDTTLLDVKLEKKRHIYFPTIKFVVLAGYVFP